MMSKSKNQERMIESHIFTFRLRSNWTAVLNLTNQDSLKYCKKRNGIPIR